VTASSAVHNDLPIHEVRAEFREAIERGPVVLSAPTGSGKSTQVPAWCAEAVGPTLVVEPRRVACRALYRFLSRDDGPSVGYVVRHERANPEADLLFVTPGVALRLLTEDSNLRRPCVVLDEFHERGMETDLVLALLADRPDLRLVVMSATMDSVRLASWLSAQVIEAKGRQYPVSVEYDVGVEIPSTKGLDDRVAQAVRRAATFLDADRGDILVFLPGKAEIAAAARALRATTTNATNNVRATDMEVIEFHAGMTGKQQDRAFRAPGGIRVVLATNVAESSVTLPWVRVVIDSGLERRTTYRRGRSVLSLSPISAQSADQRAGRAGRMASGRCIRLWDQRAQLREATVPEIQREDLDGLVMALAAVDRTPDAVRFLDPPDPRVAAAASERLASMAIIDEQGRMTDLGRQVARLPLDPDLGRLVVEAQDTDLAGDVVDLVAALSVQGRVFESRPRQTTADGLEQDRGRRRGRGGHRRGPGRGQAAMTAASEDEDLPYRCDGRAMIAALRGLDVGRPTRSRSLTEARRISDHLRAQLGLAERDDRQPALSQVIADLALRALPWSGFVRRGQRFAGGGMEVDLSQDSFAPPDSEALVVLDIHSQRTRGMKTSHQATCALPIRTDLLVRQGLVEWRIRSVRFKTGRLMGTLVAVYCDVEMQKNKDEELTGVLACRGASRLILEGRFLPGLGARIREGMALTGLWFRRSGKQPPQDLDPASWLTTRLCDLGMSSGADLALLSESDLLPDLIPADDMAAVARDFPVELALRDRACRVEYDFSKRSITLVYESGRRDPPPRETELPSWTGWTVRYRVHSRTWKVR